jgi:CRP-like cAMP-binding protein
MNLRLVIDGIVRQTTVLIAQLSTASGVRSPLAHVADQVFLELAREIEAQGVRRQVVADMFGLALRSYQKKMQRLTESATVRDRTLWQAILDVVEREAPTRARLLDRFEIDGEREVVAVLNDLVQSGLVYATGAGESTVYGITSAAVRERVQQEHDLESIANLIWVKVFRREITTRDEARSSLQADETIVKRAVDELIVTGRVREVSGVLESTNFVVPLGSDQGWEAALLDHFRAVAVAIATKVRAGSGGSQAADRIGGSTFTFTVSKGHPFENEVYGLLKKTRLEAQSLWDRVSSHNNDAPPNPDDSVRVTFYLGQTLEQHDVGRAVDGEMP